MPPRADHGHPGHARARRVHEGNTEAVQASGAVNSVDAKHMVHISHGSIGALRWASMTMDIPVGPEVNLGALWPGMRVNCTLVHKNGKQWWAPSVRPRPAGRRDCPAQCLGESHARAHWALQFQGYNDECCCARNKPRILSAIRASSRINTSTVLSALRARRIPLVPWPGSRK